MSITDNTSDLSSSSAAVEHPEETPVELASQSPSPVAAEQPTEASADPALGSAAPEQSAGIASDMPSWVPAEQPEGPSAALALDPAPTSAVSPSPADRPADPNAQKPRGRPFPPGRSGNPNGRPKGARNHITRAVEGLINDQAEELAAKAIEKALAGDSSLLRVLLSRIMPAQPARTVELELPSVETAADAPAAVAVVLNACSRGEISPAEAREVVALITTQVRIIEAADFEARLSALERDQQK
jgi:hypothetical protein